MTEALSLIYNFFDRWLILVFDNLELFDGVTIGWVIAVCIIFGILIRNIINIPKASPTYHTGWLGTRTYNQKSSVGSYERRNY